MMKFWLLIFLMSIGLATFAQEKEVEGVVFDKATNERISRVAIHNTRTGKIVYNNLKAEFKITARMADLLIVSKDGYFNDTLKVTDSDILFIYLKASATMLKQVNIKDSLESPLKRYQSIRQQYNKAYGSAAYDDLLTLTPGLGAGVSIDALWNAFSREGKKADRLQAVIERDFHESEIDYRFNKALVANITRLKEPQLTDFMRKHRPSYYVVKNYEQYEFINSIRISLKRYLRNPTAFELGTLGGEPAPATLGDKKPVIDTLQNK